jgi:hypothetical protein
VPVQLASNFYLTTNPVNQSIHVRRKRKAVAPISVTSMEMVFVALVLMASHSKRTPRVARNLIHAISPMADANTVVIGIHRKPFVNVRKATNLMPIQRHVRKFTLATRKIMLAVLINVSRSTVAKRKRKNSNVPAPKGSNWKRI